MVNTKISDLGTEKIAQFVDGEILEPALGNGTAKPGDPVERNPSTFKVEALASEFMGILVESIYRSVDEATPDGEACDLIQPTPGHIYPVKILDPAGTYNVGHPVKFGAGAFQIATNLADSAVARLVKQGIVSGDTVAWIRWGL